MAFIVKNWLDSPSTATPITAAALKDMETRLSSYSEAPASVAAPGPITSSTSLGAGATGPVPMDLRHTGAAVDRQRSRLLNDTGHTKLQAINDAYSAVVSQGFDFDHGTGVVTFANGVVGDHQTSVASVTTARTGGAASALPANPVRYLAVKDENGNRMYIPAYS